MNGRVLTEEELAVYEKRFTDIDTFNLEIDLIATIRDRDKTIAELTEDLKERNKEAWYYRDQNTVLREAMKQIVKLHDDAERMTSVTLPTTAEHRIAREALAKVSADRGVL